MLNASESLGEVAAAFRSLRDLFATLLHFSNWKLVLRMSSSSSVKIDLGHGNVSLFGGKENEGR